MSLPTVRYRLLTITMLMSFLLLGVKVGDIFRGGKEISLALVNQASAEGEADKPAAAEKAEADKAASAAIDKSAEPPPAKPADTAEKPAEAEAAKPEGEQAGGEGEKKKGGPTDVNLPGSTVTDTPPPQNKIEARKDFSQVDIDLLQSLSRRRDEIEAWAKQVEMKENMLGATEQRINDKIVQLKDLQKQLDTVLAQYNQHEDAKIRSLVKIYENMKPADAARIFDELEMPIMLEVVDKMSERKAAPILANMNPLKAKELTVELAEQRKLQQPMVDAISASQAQGASDTPPAPNAGAKEPTPAPAPEQSAGSTSIPAAPAAPAQAAPAPTPNL